jgi:hypothetical protein
MENKVQLYRIFPTSCPNSELIKPSVIFNQLNEMNFITVSDFSHDIRFKKVNSGQTPFFIFLQKLKPLKFCDVTRATRAIAWLARCGWAGP